MVKGVPSVLDAGGIPKIILGLIPEKFQHNNKHSYTTKLLGTILLVAPHLITTSGLQHGIISQIGQASVFASLAKPQMFSTTIASLGGAGYLSKMDKHLIHTYLTQQ